jgi:hypothetical protein
MPRKAPIQSISPSLSTEDSGGNTNHSTAKKMAPRMALYQLSISIQFLIASENSHREEKPSPLCVFDKDSHEERPKCASYRTPETEKSESEVSHLARSKSDSDDGDDIWHHKCCTDASESSRDGEGYKTSGTEAIDDRPDNPPRSTHKNNILMSIYCSDTAAYENKCPLCESGYEHFVSKLAAGTERPTYGYAAGIQVAVVGS